MSPRMLKSYMDLIKKGFIGRSDTAVVVGGRPILPSQSVQDLIHTITVTSASRKSYGARLFLRKKPIKPEE